MEGYWQRPAETSNVMLPGGWLRTGDIGRMDEAGLHLYIEDRKKDMILVSGFNVYPNEVENVIVEMDGHSRGRRDRHTKTSIRAKSSRVFAVRKDL